MPPRAAAHDRIDEARLLLDLARKVTASLDLQDVLDKSFLALRRLVDFGGGAIQLVEEGALRAAATDPPATPEALSVRIPVGQGISGTIAATGEPCYIPDIWADPRVHPEGRAKGVSSGVRSYFGGPLILGGEPIGVVQIDSPAADAFDEPARARVLAFLPTIAAAVQNALMFERERETLQRLEETQRIQRDFLMVVSHELRTPLTSVSGFGYTLERHAPALDAETVAEIGQRIWRAGRRLERVMGDLLDLAQIERGTFTIAVVATPVEPIVHDCAREQQDDHRIAVSVEPRLPPVMADPERLHQALGNLLSNARKFSGPAAPIEISARAEETRVAVSVTDHGRGIPGELRARVFERFFQAEPATTRTTEGMGIGLYMVKQLCARMGAEVDLESAPGAGARFTIRLRRA